MAKLDDGQIAEVRRTIAEERAKEPLIPAQKWEVGKIIAAILAGAVALLGAAGYFVVENAA